MTILVKRTIEASLVAHRKHLNSELLKLNTQLERERYHLIRGLSSDIRESLKWLRSQPVDDKQEQLLF